MLPEGPTSCSRRSRGDLQGPTFEERTTLNKFSAEATLSTITNRFRLDPAQSYVNPETRQKDPAFWMPKAPAPKKP